MRVMLDTNVLISALLFPSQKMNALFENIFTQHKLVLSSFVVDELHRVAQRKFPTRVDVIDRFLSCIAFELVYTPKKPEPGLFSIRDVNDYPVLYTAIVEDVDVLITGDKDFSDIEIEKPEILTPNEYIDRYMSN